MNINSQHLVLLRNRVEESVSHPIKTSNDFIFLSGEIKGHINDSLGVTTLKRLWGYVEGYATIRISTLDVLCRFIKNQPLYISNLTHKQSVTALFVMGNKGGLTIVKKMRQP